jgi:hypothetical protein
VQPDIAYPVNYPCDHCGASLEALANEWQDWLRCPSCGKAGRPPYRRNSARPVEDVLYIGTFTTGGASGGNGSAASFGNGIYAPTKVPSYGEGTGSGRRVMLGLGFFLSTFLALVSVAQRNPGQAGVFGFVAFIMIVFLAQSSRRG